MDKKRIKIVYKNIEDLIPYVNNPRNNEKLWIWWLVR